MSQYVRPGSTTTTYVNDIISITTPTGTVDYGDSGTASPTVVTPELAYAHTQGTSSATWTINHNLDFYPNVTVVDSAGTIVEGEIAYTSRNQIVLTFSAAFSGKAYLS
jgi:hypothetical protein